MFLFVIVVINRIERRKSEAIFGQNLLGLEIVIRILFSGGQNSAGCL